MRIAKQIFFFLLAVLFSYVEAGEKVIIDLQGNKNTIPKLEALVSTKKDNFEKSAEFSKRLCNETYKALGTSENKPITIGLEHGEYATLAKYNADKQIFVIRVAKGGNHFRAGDSYRDHFQWSNNFDPHKYIGIRIFNDYRQAPGTYSGKNAYGVSKEIKVAAESAWVLYFPPKASKSLEISYPSKTEEARRIASDLRLAIVTHIQSPCFVSGGGREPPTLKYAYDISLLEVGIIGAPNPEWILYLDSTKDILKRGRF